MKHLGDICKIDGSRIEVVDVITFGAPCQDLSVAGKRKGMLHTDMGDDETTRSGLFFEAVRIIKEMRENDKRNGRSGIFVRPRYAIYENVPGAFSSNKGADFQAVLEEIVKIVCREIPSIPIPEKGWPSAGCISGVGDSGIPFSVAWRIHDAQFWGATQYADGRMWIPGTPQRRKRIALVADFGGLTAPEVLFERKSLSGNPEQGREERQGAAGSVNDGTGESGEPIGFKPRESARARGLGIEKGISPTVSTDTNEAVLLESNQNHATAQTNGVSTALPASMGMGGGYVPMVCLNDQGGNQMSISSDQTATLRSEEHGHQPIVFGIDQQGGKGSANYSEDVSSPILSDSHGTPHAVAYGISPYDSNAMKSDNPHSGIYEADTTRTLDLNGGDPCCNQGGMAVVQGVDGYNQAVTGDVSIPIQASRVDPDHTPCVVAVDVYNMNLTGEKGRTLSTPGGGLNEHIPLVIENHPNDSRIKISEDGKVQTLSGRMGTGGNNTPMVMEHTNWNGEQTAPTLTSRNASGAQRMPDKENFNAVISFTTEQEPKIAEDKANTLRGRDYKDPPSVTFGLDRASYNQGRNAKYNVSIEKEKIGACVAKGPGAVYNSVVRRLTPEECELLQGFPKGWTDIGDWRDSKGKLHKGDSDSPRYKALGNSIALPFWAWLMKRISAQYERRATLGSLFDGISGFPLTWTRVNGIGSARWESEVEDYCIAVSKKHFGDEENGIEGDIRQWI